MPRLPRPLAGHPTEPRHGSGWPPPPRSPGGSDYVLPNPRQRGVQGVRNPPPRRRGRPNRGRGTTGAGPLLRLHGGGCRRGAAFCDLAGAGVGLPRVTPRILLALWWRRKTIRATLVAAYLEPVLA